MNRTQRLNAALTGKPVDRPPVCFYEIDGHSENPENPDAYNIYTDPSWKPLLELARDCSDRIVMRQVRFTGGHCMAETFTEHCQHEGDDGMKVVTHVHASGHELRAVRTRSRDVNTWWQTEHLLKTPEDIEAYLSLPVQEDPGRPDAASILDTESQLGDTGIVMLDTGDPLCAACSLFDMATYTIVALTEPAMFHRLLERFLAEMLPRVEAAAEALPGRLWRIYGAEYASVPYLPPSMFEEYWLQYTKPLIEAIQRHKGIARVHSHGNLGDTLNTILASGCDGLDPLEPPPQGDMQLIDIRRAAGDDFVLFGNLEISDIENSSPADFKQKVERALDEGPNQDGSRFVLMPSACPYGRKLSNRTVENYRVMVETVSRREAVLSAQWDKYTGNRNWHVGASIEDERPGVLPSTFRNTPRP